MTDSTGCYYCGTSDDLRPYGPGGAPLCFPCMKADPAREEEAERQFTVITEAAEAASPYGVAVITPDGVSPYVGGLN